jgi:hypothetical protein
MVSLNLSESQRAMVAARIANMRQGARTDLEPSANWPEVSQPQAARMLNVSERSVRRAEKIEREAIPEVAQAVERGKSQAWLQVATPKKGFVIWQPDSLKTALEPSR